MKYICVFLFIFFSAALVTVAQQSSIYSISIDTIGGNKKIHLNAFQGKNMLIVNTASADTAFRRQYSELIQLSQLYQEKLIVIVVPSNSFGTENSGPAAMLQNYFQGTAVRFPVTDRVNVKNPDIHPLFRWLTSLSDNGVTNSEVKGSFYKFLIDKNGRLVGSFGSRLTPMNSVIRNAIERL